MSTIIKAELVKALRDKTSVSMMECKRALEKTGGDLDAAIDLLRQSGEATAVKKQGRIAAEGVVILMQDLSLHRSVVLEVNCETDFVAKNNKLLEFAQETAKVILNKKITDLDLLALEQLSDGNTIGQARLTLLTQLGENIVLRRAELVQASPQQHLGIYQHGLPPKIGCIVCLEGGDANLAKDIAMHIVAMRPEYLTSADISEERYQKELEILTEQTKQINRDKSEDLLKKITIGRVKKFFKEITLVEQTYIKDPDLTIGQLLSKHKAKIIKVSRLEVGKV